MAATITVFKLELLRHPGLSQTLEEMSKVVNATPDSFVYTLKPGMLFTFLTKLSSLKVGYTTQFEDLNLPEKTVGKQTLTVLCVDNDPEDLELFCDGLRVVDPAIKCFTALGGAQALELLEKQQETPDYIFLDINMPRIDGKQALREIRKIDRYASAVIVMFSTGLRPEDAKEYLNLGANHFMTKANSLKDLCEKLRAFF